MGDSIDDLRRKLREELGLEIDTSNRKGLSDSDVQLRASRLLPSLARKLGSGEDALRGRLTIGLDDGLWLEGKTTSDDGWRTFQVSLSTGLLLFHHKMVSLFVSRMTVVADENEIADEAKISDREMLSAAKRVMEAFWAQDAPMEHFLRTPGFSLTQLTKSQLQLAASLLHYAEEFVIAHEFGHILMNAAPDRVKRELLIVNGARESMVSPVLAQFERSGNGRTLQSWMDEIAADFIGAVLCKETVDGEIQRIALHGAAAMSLVMCDMLERFYQKLHAKSWDPGSHPPSGLRLDVLQTLSGWSAGQFAASLRQFADYIMERM